MNKLILHNFRIHKDISFEFDSPVNLIIGANGIGKTSILEALYFLATTRSFRTSKDEDLINTETNDFVKVELIIDNTSYKIVLTNETKKVFINNNEINKFSDYIGAINTIVFSPSDIELIKGFPSDRRKFIDLFISSIDKEYLVNLIEYKKVIKDKNIFLKQEVHNYQLLDTYNELLSKYAKIITIKRHHYINLINSKLEDKYKIEYEPNFDELDEIESILKSKRNIEILNKISLYGTHKDDLIFKYENKDSKVYASQGQLRLLMINIKIAMLKIIQELKKDNIILLLDDIFSELDKDNTKLILDNIPNNCLVLITDTKQIKLKKGYKLIKLKG